jgi:hypothetical protein
MTKMMKATRNDADDNIDDSVDDSLDARRARDRAAF